MYSATGVLNDDTDPDGGPAVDPTTTAPAHGTLTFYSNGAFTYTPTANYSGADSFTYTVSDGKGGTDTATVNSRSPRSTTRPVADNDAYTTDEDTPLSGSPRRRVLNGDTDVDGGTLFGPSPTPTPRTGP